MEVFFIQKREYELLMNKKELAEKSASSPEYQILSQFIRKLLHNKPNRLAIVRLQHVHAAFETM